MLRPKGMGSMLKCWASSKLLRRRRSLSSVRPSVSRRRHRPPLVFADSTGIIGIATSKACVAFFLLRIVVILWHQIVLWVCVIAAAVICILCALFDFIRCDPVEGVWNPTVKATCWMGTEAFTDLSVGVGVTSVICDFVLALLPWAILWGLNMKKKEKRIIGISMSLGVL